MSPAINLSSIPPPHTKGLVRRKEAINRQQEKSKLTATREENKGVHKFTSPILIKLKKIGAPNIPKLVLYKCDKTCYFWYLTLEPCPLSDLNSAVIEQTATDMHN